MRLTLTVLCISLITIAVFSLYVRLASSDVKRWHVDPETVKLPDTPNAFKETYVLDVSKNQIVANWIAPKSASESSLLLAGDLNDGYATFIARTKVFGFPDYVSFKLVENATNKSTLYVFSRSRFGLSDLGRNKARIEEWVTRLRQNLGT